MNKYNILPTQILAVKVIKYSNIYNGVLEIDDDYSNEEELRLVLYIDKKLIDFETQQELEAIPHTNDGYVAKGIYTNTLYYVDDEMYLAPDAIEFIETANQVYERYLQTKDIARIRKRIY